MPVSDLVSKFGVEIPGVVDGSVLTQAIGTALARGQFARVPVINGITHDEELLFVAGLGITVSQGTNIPLAGVNPSLTITALAERATSLCPNKADADTRPPLGSGYELVNPVMPHRLVVPAGAPGELRLDARQADVIPNSPTDPGPARRRRR